MKYITALWLLCAITVFSTSVTAEKTQKETEVNAAQEAAHNEVIVELDKFAYIPRELTVKVGTTVKWVNKETRQYHSVWFKEQGEEPGEYFFPGESVSKFFDKPGRYPYVCEPHEKRMTGVIIVVE
jgi:plastocyanin